MRYAIISDVHSNLEALTAVLDDAAAAGVDAVLCLGDIVGYGANPNQCVDLIARGTKAAVAGNHDHAALGLTDVESFNPYARAAAEWTRRTLGASQAAFLRTLPLTTAVAGVPLVPATPLEPEEWRYVLSAVDAAGELQGLDERLCFIGHSHLPAGFE